MKSLLFITLVAVFAAVAYCGAHKSSSDEVVMFIFQKDCFDTLLSDYWMSKKCFLFTLSKGISMGILVFSTIVKVPQILKIVEAKSVAGLSLTAFFSELIALTVTVGYNYHHKHPFSTYGENLFVLLQALVIFLMFPKYSKKLNPAEYYGYIAAWLALVVCFALDVVPEYIYQSLAVINIGITISARLPQVIANFKNGSTGQLSITTSTLNFLGVTARIFTTLQEVSDPLVLFATLNATLWNGLLFLQCMIYLNSKLKEDGPATTTDGKEPAKKAEETRKTSPKKPKRE